MKHPYFPLLLTGILVGCASARVEVVFPRIEPPEVLGDAGAYEAGFGLGGVGFYEYTSDASARPLVLSTPRTGDRYSFHAEGKYSISEPWTIGLQLIGVGGVGLTTQYQLLGQPTFKAVDGSSLSVFSHLGQSRSVTGGNQRKLFGEGGYPWSAQMDSQYADIGLSYGIRHRDSLFYLGLGVGQQRLKGRVHHGLSATGDSPEADYDFPTIQGSSATVGLGVVSDLKSKGDKINFSYNLHDTNLGGTRFTSNTLNLTWTSVLASSRSPVLVYQEKSTWQGRDYLAVPVAWFIGFGSGQSVQGTWQTKGHYFFLAELTGAAMIANATNFYGAGSATSLGAALWAGARVWGIVDTIIEASSTRTAKPSSTTIAPHVSQNSSGLKLTHTF